MTTTMKQLDLLNALPAASEGTDLEFKAAKGGLPFAVVINAKGQIVKTVLGEVPPGRFEELVRPLL